MFSLVTKIIREGLCLVKLLSLAMFLITIIVSTTAIQAAVLVSPSYQEYNVIELSIPNDMRINQSEIITITVNIDTKSIPSTLPLNLQQLLQNSQNNEIYIVASIRGSAFDIIPLYEQRILISNQDKYVFNWSIVPRNIGQQSINVAMFIESSIENDPNTVVQTIYDENFMTNVSTSLFSYITKITTSYVTLFSIFIAVLSINMSTMIIFIRMYNKTRKQRQTSSVEVSIKHHIEKTIDNVILKD